MGGALVASAWATVPNTTEQEQARARGEQDAAIALAGEDRWQIAGGGMLTVKPVGTASHAAERVVAAGSSPS